MVPPITAVAMTVMIVPAAIVVVLDATAMAVFVVAATAAVTDLDEATGMRLRRWRRHHRRCRCRTGKQETCRECQ
jgi:hypothetical protein